MVGIEKLESRLLAFLLSSITNSWVAQLNLAHLRVESLLSYSGEERDAGHGCSQLPPRKGRSQLQHSQAVHDSSGKGRSLFGAATQSNNGIGESSCHAVICGSATDGERVINDPSAAIPGLKLVSWGTLRETTVMEDSLWRWSAGTLNHNICDGKSFRILRRKEPYDRWSKVSGAVRQNNSGCIQQLYCKILDTLHIPDSRGPNCGTFLGCQGMTRNLDRDRVQPMESLQGEDLRVNISSSGMFFQTTLMLSKLSDSQRLQRKYCRTENLIWEYCVSGVLTVFKQGDPQNSSLLAAVKPPGKLVAMCLPR
ncbi:uncharacterized protein LOC128916238 [Rissa tridactyla]|uniref:uncharacterized protein LOC128916238 n=1 Tax=Rissa tridactyla TaxID=75485 RepID=UPI0023BA790B|nr:uncharacterized protein LOC128916238 [Rissa tridactyla]